MKRFNLLVAAAVLAALPTTALAAPGGHLGCGPAGDIAEPTGLALTKTTEPVKAKTAPVVVDQPLQNDDHEVHVSDHDILLICCTALVVILLIIIF